MSLRRLLIFLIIALSDCRSTYSCQASACQYRLRICQSSRRSWQITLSLFTSIALRRSSEASSGRNPFSSLNEKLMLCVRIACLTSANVAADMVNPSLSHRLLYCCLVVLSILKVKLVISVVDAITITFFRLEYIIKTSAFQVYFMCFCSCFTVVAHSAHFPKLRIPSKCCLQLIKARSMFLNSHISFFKSTGNVKKED